MPCARFLLSFAILVAFATATQAATIHNTFLTSSTGTAGGLVEADTIQFELTVTTTAGRNYDTIFWSLSGDRTWAQVKGLCADCFTPAHTVTRWDWHYAPVGGAKVDIGTNGRITPFAPPLPPPSDIVGPFGMFGVSKTGDGIPALVGTVTIVIGPHRGGGLDGTGAPLAGIYEGGAIQYPGVDGFLGSGGADTVAVTGGTFTVVPEPSTGLMFAAGLVLLVRVSHGSRRG